MIKKIRGLINIFIVNFWNLIVGMEVKEEDEEEEKKEKKEEKEKEHNKIGGRKKKLIF